MSHKPAKLILLISLVEKIMETSNYHVFERVIKLYQILPRSPQSAICIGELKQRLGKYYNESSQDKSLTKALQRDLRLLTLILSAGNLLRTDGKGNQPSSFRLSHDASIESFKPELALVLVMANTYLRQYLPQDIYEKVEGFFDSAEQQLKKHTTLEDWQNRIRFIHADYSSTEQDWSLTIPASNIYYALLNKNYWLKTKYKREYDNTVNDYILKPHGIINRGRKQFLIASKIIGSKSELRTFVINRFQEVEIVPEKLIIDVDSYDIDELIQNHEYEMAYFDREVVSLKIRCNDELLDEIEEIPFEWKQNIEKTKHGYFYVTAQIMVTQTVFDWLISKAHSVKVIEPQELSHRIRHKVARAAELYEIEWDIIDEEEYPLDNNPILEEEIQEDTIVGDVFFEENWEIGEEDQEPLISNRYEDSNSARKKHRTHQYLVNDDFDDSATNK